MFLRQIDDGREPRQTLSINDFESHAPFRKVPRLHGALEDDFDVFVTLVLFDHSEELLDVDAVAFEDLEDITLVEEQDT